LEIAALICSAVGAALVSAPTSIEPVPSTACARRSASWAWVAAAARSFEVSTFFGTAGGFVAGALRRDFDILLSDQ
jgi:hypothetical protein